MTDERKYTSVILYVRIRDTGSRAIIHPKAQIGHITNAVALKRINELEPFCQVISVFLFGFQENKTLDLR